MKSLLRDVPEIALLRQLMSRFSISRYYVGDGSRTVGWRAEQLTNPKLVISQQQPEQQKQPKQPEQPGQPGQPEQPEQPWASHEEQTRKKRDGSRHSNPSSGFTMFRTLVALIVYCVLLFVQTLLRKLRIVVPWNSYPVINFMLQREESTIQTPFWQLIHMYLIPTALAMFMSFMWWRRIYAFYCNRQPWVSLRTSQPPRLGLTLTYGDGVISTIKKSFRNHHWIVTFLGLGTIMHTIVPVLQITLYKPSWHSENPGNVTARTPYSWTNDLIATDGSVSQPFDDALVDMIGGLESWTRMPKWSTRMTAFQEMNFDEPSEESGLWFLPTATIAGRLHCESVEVNLNTIVDESGLTRVESMELTTRDIPSRKHVLPWPCRKGEEDASHLKDSSIPATEAYCGRWWPLGSDEAESGGSVSSLGIIWLSGNAIRTEFDRDIFFTEVPTIVSLICKPKITKSSGPLVISSLDFKLGDATIFEYTPTEETVLEPEVGLQVVENMMTAVREPISISTNGTFTNTPSFTGDIVSYAIHRHINLQRSAPMDATTLERAASLIFSTYFAALAQRSNLFKHTINATVQVEPRRIEFVLDVNKPAFFGLVIFACVWLLTFLTLDVRIPKAFRFAFPPERLKNSLFLIARGSLVDLIEERIPHLDQMEPEAVLREIEKWDEHFKFTSIEVDGVIQYALDVAARTDNENEATVELHRGAGPECDESVRDDLKTVAKDDEHASLLRNVDNSS